MMIPRDKEQMYLDICSEWEKLTKLELEHDTYKKIILRDINNYVAVFSNGKVKCKGAFEVKEKDAKLLSHLHKNKSFLVIQKAIYEYFINGIAPEDYIKTNTNIYDFCGYIRVHRTASGDWELQAHSLKEGKVIIETLQNFNRYFISKKGIKLVKVNIDTKAIEKVHADKVYQTIANKNPVFNSNLIDYNWYLKEIYKEITNIQPLIQRGYKQQELF